MKKPVKIVAIGVSVCSLLFNFYQFDRNVYYYSLYRDELWISQAEYELLHRIYSLDKKSWEKYKNRPEYKLIDFLDENFWDQFYSEQY